MRYIYNFESLTQSNIINYYVYSFFFSSYIFKKSNKLHGKKFRGEPLATLVSNFIDRIFCADTYMAPILMIHADLFYNAFIHLSFIMRSLFSKRFFFSIFFHIYHVFSIETLDLDKKKKLQ